MKKHSLVALICALCLILSSFIIPASALAKGDADGNGEITAADARLVLRYSVKLENLNENAVKASDVDGSGSITAADARLILRVSVKLESFCEHVLDKEALKQNKLRCSKCGWEGVEAFNNTVNDLKKSENKFSNFSKTASSISTPEYSDNAIGKLLKTMIGNQFDSAATQKDDFSDFINKRLITNDNFPVTGKNFVSDLKSWDISSYSVEKINGIDFVEGLSDYTTENGKKVNLKKFKESAPQDSFYKITLYIKDETFTAGQNPNSDSALNRIYMNDYNKMLYNLTNEQQLPDLKGLIKMDFNVTTKSKVVYYINAENLSPAAAEYDISMNIVNQLNTYFNLLWQTTDKPTGFMKMKISTDINDYFFFNDYFDTSDIK